MLAKLRGVRGFEWIALLIVLSVAALLIGQGAPSREAGSTELEARMERVLSSVAGAGRVRVMIHTEDAVSAFGGGASAPKILGVVVVAEGASDLRVALELARAARSLTGVDADAIEVFKMEGERPG